MTGTVFRLWRSSRRQNRQNSFPHRAFSLLGETSNQGKKKKIQYITVRRGKCSRGRIEQEKGKGALKQLGKRPKF